MQKRHRVLVPTGSGHLRRHGCRRDDRGGGGRRRIQRRQNALIVVMVMISGCSRRRRRNSHSVVRQLSLIVLASVKPEVKESSPRLPRLGRPDPHARRDADHERHEYLEHEQFHARNGRGRR